jgi:hypothetical protein
VTTLVDAAVDQAAAPKMLVSPSVLDFGSPYVGGEYVKSLTIANVGGSVLTVSSLNLIEDRTTGAFSVSAQPTPFGVQAGETVTVTVVLRPNDENLPTGSIKIHSDDPDASSADATVDLVAHAKGSPRLGICVRNPTPPPDCIVSNDNNPLLDYGTVAYGSTTERVVALTNVGDGNLPVDVTEIAISDPTFFATTLFQAVDDPANPGQKIEQPATLPFFLSIGDATVSPPVPPTELRVHIKFTAVGIDGDVPHESIIVKYKLTESPSTIPIVGKIQGCKPASVDGGVPDGGADPQTDPNNCGACGTRCQTAHGTPSCVAGVCKTGSCDDHFGDCDDDPANGCETDLRTTAGHCGTCATVCANPHGTTGCQNGVCLPSCDNGYDDCDGNPVNGCETRTSTDSNNCGSCGTVCSNQHGTNLCLGGVCTPTCASTWTSCDGDPRNGCETNTNVDVNNCGACGTVCENAGGSVSCSGGQCHPGCAQGYADCDGNSANGCESAVMTDVAHCGSCAVHCLNGHGTTTCAGGACLPSCAASFGDCDSNPDNGCEAAFQTDINNCGGCLKACTNAQANNSTCVAGACTAPVCISGYGNCDGDNWNGCETQVNTVDHCGSCTNKCLNPNGTTSCNGTACVPVCAGGFGDCNGNPSDGCETDTTTSGTHCGGCGKPCTNTNGSGSVCSGSACTPPVCAQGFANCDTNNWNGCETNLLTDTDNCGACGFRCQNAHGGTACVAGVCVPTCLGGYDDCDGHPENGCELFVQNDNANCGGCAKACTNANGSGSQCTSGACTAPTCNGNFANCDGNNWNGCEVDLRSTTDHCGTCAVACVNAHGSTACQSSVCSPSCDPSWGNCDANPVNGCETDLQTTSAHCGGCNRPCTSAHGSNSTCSGGACTAPTCDPNWGNCDSDNWNGCETDLLSTLAHCGGCNQACTNAHASGSVCSGGSCTAPSCNGGYANCDNDNRNGCETATNTIANCAGCGNACDTAQSQGASCNGSKCTYTGCVAGYTNCNNGGPDTNGCETHTDADADNCGGCNRMCSNSNMQTRTCAGGACNGSCANGYADCNSDKYTDGCETQTTTTLNCGGCGNVCDTAHSTGVSCNGTKCNYGGCAAGWTNCNLSGVDTNGCETHTDVDANNCGGCGNACSSSHVTPSCAGGVCNGACAANWADCNGNKLTDGCETSTTTTSDCGGCGNACDTVHSTGTGCNGTKCTYGGCAANYANCDTSGADTNGCETPTTTITNCAGCGNGCDTAHSTGAACNGTKCTYTGCATNFANCNSSGVDTNGCETPTNTTTNCAGCGNVCDTSHSNGASCDGARCIYTGCALGYTNCSATAPDTNGCETWTDGDANNCGACNRVCSNSHVPVPSCGAGVCNGTCEAGYADCNGNKQTDGCETFVLGTDVSHCGSCAACSTNNVTAHCTGGVCDGACAAGWSDCNANKQSDGCETHTSVDPTNCGGCGASFVCSGANVVTPHCTNGVCDGNCVAGWADCNGNKLTDGCEIHTDVDANNCGGCGAPFSCSGSNMATRTCTGGVCNGTCAAGYMDCNANKLTDGGETYVLGTDTAHCGSCSACSSSNVTPHCTGGVCDGACAAGWTDCNGNKQSDGCETHTAVDVNNCGGCGTVCSGNNIPSRSCTGGACDGVCAAGFRDCDGNKQTNGCETDINNDPNNCGGCGIVCSGNNMATRTCVAGVCNGTCAAGFGDCDGNKQTNGCERNLNNDPDNCGLCGTVCSGNNMAARTCGGGVCNGTCAAGYADCDGNKQTNGCEKYLTNDPDNCGGCGTVCSNSNMATRTCGGGVCNGTCAANWTDCDGNKQTNGCEKNLTNDPDNCGGCGTVCSASNMATRTCGSGVCNGTCAANWTDCDGNKQTNGCEKDLTNDPDNCGGCGTVCSGNNMATRTCGGGVCNGTCAANFTDCDGNKQTNGCEKDLTNDPDNCGGCGTVCSGNNMATRTCGGGVCNGTCAANWTDCDGNKQTNGCERNLTNDPDNCGVCGRVCSNNNMTTRTCGGGVCNGTCAANFSDCDGNKQTNGCERNLTNDPDNCGGCGTVCSGNNMATRACGGGVCNGACAANWTDCDGNKQANGCEKNLTNDPDNCGVCGRVCSDTNMATRTCGGGVCNGTCTGGYTDCDGNKQTNGCETNTSATPGDPNNCGGCGAVCSGNHMASRTCNGGACDGACASPWVDTNGNKLGDGCECQDLDPGNKVCGAAINIGASHTCEAMSWSTCYQTCCNWYASFNTYSWSWSCYGAGGGYVCNSDDLTYCSGGGTYQCNPYPCAPWFYTGQYSCDGVDDNGKSATATGNIPLSGGEVWYVVNALNTHWDRTSWGGGNPFNVKIGFTSNPGDEFQLQVYTNCSGGAAGCPDGGTPVHQTMPTDQWEYNATGENPCKAAAGVGYQQCQNHAQTLYIRVTRRTAPSCSSFTLQVTNG